MYSWLKIKCEPTLFSKAILQTLLLFHYLAKFGHQKTAGQGCEASWDPGIPVQLRTDLRKPGITFS
jgi:hypothetical protein